MQFIKEHKTILVGPYTGSIGVKARSIINFIKEHDEIINDENIGEKYIISFKVKKAEDAKSMKLQQYIDILKVDNPAAYELYNVNKPIIKEVKPKKAAPAQPEEVAQPKRGKPKKEEVAPAQPKRGRPKKEVIEEVDLPKRGIQKRG